MTTSLRTLLVPLLGLALLAAPRAASACYDSPDCALPPGDAWGSGYTQVNGGNTWDTRYVNLWSGSSSQISEMWNGLEMSTCDWDEGWGFYAVGDLGKPLSRLMNGAYVVRLVEGYAKIPGFGLWRNVTGIPEQRFERGEYWQFSTDWGDDEWEPSCEDGSAVASHRQDTDEYNKLHIPGAYRYEAIKRGSTIVHETTHQEVGHIDDNACNPPSGSCDDYYSKFNSNTMQINFLHDAALTYRTAQGSSGPVRKVLRSAGQCSLWARFTSGERNAAISRANAVMNRFNGGPPGGWMFQISGEVTQAMNAETFACANCSLAKYTFDPNVCQQSACNELMRVENAAENLNNRNACLAYNAALSGGNLTEESIADAWDQFVGDLRGCGGNQPEETLAFCAAERATANHVSQVDPCGWLEASTPGFATTKLGCVRQFCKDKFDSDPNAGWQNGDDSYGCLDYLCGGPECGDAGDREKCVLQFLMVEGGFQHIAQCEWKGCNRVLLDCLLPIWQGGQWSVGDPIPMQCELAVLNCKIMSKLASLILVNMNPFLDPGPLHEIVNPALQSTSPTQDLFDAADQLRRLAAAGVPDEQLEDLAIELTSSPEMVNAMYELMPEQFAWLYGQQGFEGLLPPSLQNVTPAPISMGDLNAQGQAALADFEAMRAGLPPGGIPGTIGSFTPTAGP